MTGIDKRGRLEEEPFSWRATKEGTIFVAWQGKTVLTLKGDKARRLQRRLADADPQQVQLALGPRPPATSSTATNAGKPSTALIPHFAQVQGCSKVRD